MGSETSMRRVEAGGEEAESEAESIDDELEAASEAAREVGKADKREGERQKGFDDAIDSIVRRFRRRKRFNDSLAAAARISTANADEDRPIEEETRGSS